MGLFNIIDPALNLIFGPLKILPPLFGLMILALIITFITTIIYKYTTDQKLMKSLRDKQKKLQEEMKKNRDNPKKMMKINQEMMQMSMSMMKESFKSMFYTIVPILILFGWIASNFSFLPAAIGEPINVQVYADKTNGNITLIAPPEIDINSEKIVQFSDNFANFTITPRKQGNYELVFEQNTKVETKQITVEQDGDFRDVKLKKTLFDAIYSSPEGGISTDSTIKQIKVDYRPIRPFGDFSFFGWRPGWFGTYIIFSLVFTMLLRKVMKVY